MASCVSSGLVTIAASIPAARSWSVSSTQARCSPNARAARARICGSGSAPPTRRAPRPVLTRFAAMALLAPRPMIPMRSSATMVPPSGECRLWAPSIILVADGLCNILDKSIGTSAWADCAGVWAGCAGAWVDCAGARARPDVVRADTGGASRARRGRTRRRHGLRCDGAFLAREERAVSFLGDPNDWPGIPGARGAGTAQGAGSPAISPSGRTRKRPGADAGASAPSPPPPTPCATSSSRPSRPTSNGGGALAARHGRTRHRPHSRPPHPHDPHPAH